MAAPRRFAAALCLLTSACLTCLLLASCGGDNSGSSGLKIADRPGMLGGEGKPEVFSTTTAGKGLSTVLGIGQGPRSDTIMRGRLFWYEADLAADATYVVTLQPPQADEDADLYAFRPPSGQLQQIGFSRRGHDGDTLATPDWVGFNTQQPGRHQFAVYGFSPTAAGDPNDYRIEVDQARGIAVNGDARTGTVALADSRWFTFAGVVGTSYTVTLQPDAGQDVDLFVYGGASHLLRGQSTVAGSGIDSVQFVAAASGRHFVRVYGPAAGSFTLTVTSDVPDLTNLFFLHHSVGSGFIEQGNMRSVIANWNTAHGRSFTFWDHGYNYEGLRNAAGDWTGSGYGIPDDNTDPSGLHTLWCSARADALAARNQILSHHDVIALKSCFPNSAITDAEMLQNYKNWYLQMRNVFDSHPDHLFVVMSTPPLHRLATNTTEANNARAFANWLKSATYLSGHPNIVCFDVFDRLARANDGSARANRLRYEYEGSHSDSDSHPNEAANQVVGAALANFICDATEAYNASR